MTMLSMSGSFLNKQSVAALCQGLVHSNVEVLDLSHAELSRTSMAAVLRVLPRTNIRSLNLRANSFGARGTAALFDARIRELDASNNDVDDDVYKCLALALPKLLVRKVDLYDNPLTDAAALVLPDCLSKSSRLVQLLVERNDLSKDAEDALIQAAQEHRVRLWTEFDDVDEEDDDEVIPKGQ
ncbi:Aste57867_12026 [Aphanomyces stellatus]|uniref:Aste57867_12026 protein n=1 Tax=Aphanomyces stellatus TaxID=120398 RepID=A0A485KUH5_9STRA|nr:hypothetical protein As57867_011981 [Aphanomyces stellatus]VFT88881.1 Aste57867_12026 [Aphanomyces stellatus]